MALRSLESRLHAVTGGNGAIYAVRPDAYLRVDAVMGHDLAFPYAIVKRGSRAVYVPEARATEKMVPSIEGEWARKRRMMSHAWPIVLRGGMLDPAGYPPRYALMIASHRVLRYAAPFLHLVLLVVSLLRRPRAGRLERALARRAGPAPGGRRGGRARADRAPCSSRATTSSRRPRSRWGCGTGCATARRPAGRRRRGRADDPRAAFDVVDRGGRAAGGRARARGRGGRDPPGVAGHVVYRQRRVGLDGREFDVLKLRTMVTGAEAMGAGLAVDEGDSRITRVGALLRRTSIDELPNLVNVLRGDMAIVGPRPTVPVQVAQYTDRQRGRLAVRPGITGWAQVNGRASLPWHERIELDLWYVEHRSWRLDLEIIARTARLVVRRGRALQGGDGRMAQDLRFRALVAEREGDEVRRSLRDLGTDDLPEGDVTIRVAWSSVNYKDSLAVSPTGQVARISPLVPGIDLAGEIVEGEIAGAGPGDTVLAHGYDIGVSHHGGFAELARMPAGWVVPLPAGLTARDAMALGTAGFTAALSIAHLEDAGLTPATVRSSSSARRAASGRSRSRSWPGSATRSHASTGKPDEADMLRELGAAEVLEPRRDLRGQRPAARAAALGRRRRSGRRPLAGLRAADGAHRRGGRVERAGRRRSGAHDRVPVHPPRRQPARRRLGEHGDRRSPRALGTSRRRPAPAAARRSRPRGLARRGRRGPDRRAGRRAHGAARSCG